MNSPRDTVLDPAATPALTTVADVKAFAGIAGAEFDTILTGLIDVASQVIERFCGCLVTRRSVVETVYQCEPVFNIVLTFSDVASISALTFDDTAVDLAGVAVLKGPGILRRKDGTAFSAGTIVITYDAGPLAPLAPIVQAANELSKMLLEQKDRRAGVSRESVPDVADVTFATDENVTRIQGANGVSLPSNIAFLLLPFVQRFAP